MSKTRPVLGIIGGGQLGSMLCQSAKKIKINTVILCDDINAPAQNFCDKFVYSKYDDFEKILNFINLVDIVTYEFENIPIETLKYISKKKKVLPDPKINEIIQNRKTEKEFINKLNIKTTKWSHIKSKKDLMNNKKLLPGILKTCTLGYDGKGQHTINNINELKDSLNFKTDYILEEIVNLKKEISVILTRFNNGDISIFEPIENSHSNKILRNSFIPAKISNTIYNQAIKYAKEITRKFNYVGTLCVEYFIDNEDNLLVNEIAPRVHNSGHLTLEAFEISQFENHVRAVCDLGKKENLKLSNAKMKNIIGDEIKIYREKKLNKKEFFYDYLKKEIKENRKMGHITILCD